MPLISTSSGELLDAPGLLGLGRSGIDVRLPREDELCELPEGATLQFLEGRQPVVRETAAGESFPLDGFLAAAVQLPSGYCRTLLPAYEKFAGPPYLPFFGYTAVFARGTKLYCAAVQTDSNPHWEPKHYSPPQLEKTIAARIARQPENRVLGQLKTCALEYGCYNAQNIFLNRWEGAVPVSPACNAQCVGCISEQPDDLPASPQTRFKFVPTENEIVELGLEHLRDPDSIFSFGQGCEGEPLLQGDLIARTVKSMRAQTNKGTLHLNTNASRPVQFAKIVEAGLDSVRVSLNSLLPETYTSYYQPRGYEFKALLECMEIAKTNGVIIYLNYLHIPGWNDRESEVEALSEAVERYGIQMIQMRNLNIDPELYLGQVAIPAGDALGIKTALDRLRAQHPSLRIGNHTLPKKAFSKR
jgi:wyosine [tRNA(Phe)-imidazoG37] synthetase (radical SAM superfamily)